MAKSLDIDTNNSDKEGQLNAKKRKFRTWRDNFHKKEKRHKLKQASYEEIKNMLHTLEPELDDYDLFYGTLLYYYALFIHNFFEESLKSKIDFA